MIEIHYKDDNYAHKARDCLMNALESSPYTYSIFRNGHILRISTIRIRRDQSKSMTGPDWEEFRAWALSKTNKLEKASRR